MFWSSSLTLGGVIAVIPRSSTLAKLKEGIQKRATEIEKHFLAHPDTANLIISTCFTQFQFKALRELKEKLHPNDTLVVGTNIFLYRALEKEIGAETIALISEDIPLGFIDSFFLHRLQAMSEEELNAAKKKHLGNLEAMNFTLSQRNNGFLQVGDTAYSLRGNRWNMAFNESFLELDGKDLIVCGGDNFVHNGERLLLIMNPCSDNPSMHHEHGKILDVDVLRHRARDYVAQPFLCLQDPQRRHVLCVAQPAHNCDQRVHERTV